MQLVSFIYAGRPGFGLLQGDRVLDLTGRLDPAISSLRQLLAADRLGEVAAIAARETPDIALDGLTLLPVIPDPDKIICVGMNYREHAAEVGREVTAKPALFARFPGSQVGHLQPLIKPAASDQFDYEGELAVIIGKAGRHVPPQDALSHVAGYACYNEGSVRDWQRHTSQFLAGKSFSRTGGFGPCLTTAEEVGDPTRLTLTTRLNGEIVQQASVGELITAIPDLIAYCSTVIELIPGDVIVTGTPGGVGLKRNPPLFMKPGDVAEVEIPGVGHLVNPVQAEAA